MKIEPKHVESVGRTPTGQWQIVLSRNLPDELVQNLSLIGQTDALIGNTEEHRNIVAANFLKRTQQSQDD